MEMKKLFASLIITALSIQAYADDVATTGTSDGNNQAQSQATSAVKAANIAADSMQNNVSLPIPALKGGMQVDALKLCVKKIGDVCNQFQIYEQRDNCINQQFSANAQQCQQAQAVYQKMGLMPNRVQAIGPVTVFTLLHIADGQETFYMVDRNGEIISLVDDSDAAINTSKQFELIKKQSPTAGLMQLTSGDVSQIPQVLMPQELANKKEDDYIQLVFPQMIKSPPCLACQDVAVADISYRFTNDGQYKGISWLKTEQVIPVMIDRN